MAGKLIEVQDDERREQEAKEASQAPQASSQSNNNETSTDVQVSNNSSQETKEEIPEKYRGKSPAELIKMHQEAEKLVGKQSNEVGSLRSMIDSYVQTQTTQLAKPQFSPTQQEETNDEDEIDFFSDPQAAIRREIQNNPAVKSATQQAAYLRQATATAQLEKAHPDKDAILQDPKFAEWISQSNVRKEMLYKADQQYDFESANELFSLWKDRRSAVNQTINAEQKTRQAAARKASTGTGNRTSSEPRGRKKLRRADIIRLMVEQPDVYASRADEILKAYQNNLVV